MSDNGSTEAPNLGNKVTVVLGAQWGDEGKGKVVDLLAQDADMVCRCQVYADASLVFPLLVAETFAHQASKLMLDKK